MTLQLAQPQGGGSGGASEFTGLTDTPSSYSEQGSKAVRVASSETALEFYTPTDANDAVKVSSNDTTAGFLNGKLLAGPNITLTENADGGNETLTISSGGGTTTTNNYASILPPQLFNPDATGVSGNTDAFTLSSANSVAFVTLNGQVLDDSEYSLSGPVLTVTPDTGFSSVADEVLVFQFTFAVTGTGGETYNLVQKSSTYSVSTTDSIIECTANSFVVTLPSASGIGGQRFTIKNSGTGIITVDGSGSETIDGQISFILTQYESLTVASNGTNFIII